MKAGTVKVQASSIFAFDCQAALPPEILVLLKIEGNALPEGNI